MIDNMMKQTPSRGGWIEMICGPMFCGKSDELIRRADRAMIAKQKVKAFKPSIDDRYHKTEIASHAGARLEASLINGEDLDELRDKLILPTGHITADVVVIDEVQFLSTSITQLAEDLANGGARVILAGLDMDFLRRPFGPMPDLLVAAEFVDKLQAVCTNCSGPAFYTQRLMADGSPAGPDDPLVLVGAQDSYEARCRACHSVG